MSLSNWDAPNGSYSSAIPSGTRAFRTVVAQAFGYSRTEVVRDPSRCRQTRSEHCECGAIDFFTTDLKKGRKLFDWCVENANELGIQSVIFNRRVIGFGNPNERNYTGPSPHTDHVHVGLKRWARADLTEAKVKACLGQEEDDLPYTEQQLRQFMREEAREAAREALNEKVNMPASGSVAWFAARAWKALWKQRPNVSPPEYDEHLNVIEEKIDALGGP